ncbi:MULTISPECIES: LysE family translocator [unclassified Pseudomonas]|uniref:LysE family translocator n=1 Tax=unclassified Pseudomonas TaxID=196821 RepID=UPI002B23C804|nr:MULTISPECIES: LysE family translocator [unclassified Pseudomonas]MEA9978495.1 LysE family translocator [Pseudomonas sp. RTS4]MEB0199039.1 LysE family translocator [Pseudomonas sp. 5S4]MEB0248152.1 LysE family translocator [Pseudomonas sp. 10S5]
MLSVGNTLRYGAAAMAATLAGNLTAQMLLTSAVTLGVGAILTTVPMPFMAIKVLGAGALIYLGVRQLFAPVAAAEAIGQLPANGPTSKWRIASQAFLVSGSNPNTLMFLCVFLPQFIEKGQAMTRPFLIMIVTMASTVTVVHSLYCTAAHYFSKRLRAARWAGRIKRICGVIFIGVSVHLLDARIL